MNRLIIILILLFITLIFGLLLVLPKNEELNFLEKKARERKAELQSKEEYLANLNRISQELKDYEIQLAKIDSALPEDPQLPALFDFLQKSASQSGLVLRETGVTLSTPGLGGGIRETWLNLVLTGSYPSLKNFLSILENSARLIETQSLSFSMTQEGSFNFNLRTKVYSY